MYRGPYGSKTLYLSDGFMITLKLNLERWHRFFGVGEGGGLTAEGAPCVDIQTWHLRAAVNTAGGTVKGQGCKWEKKQNRDVVTPLQSQATTELLSDTKD